MIKIDKLNKFFNKGRQNEIHVINDVSLELPEKGMVAIFGRSGCGKTTLLNVIGGLDGFSDGSVTIEGKNIRSNTDVLRNQYIGYIFQNYNLHKNESCFDNVADALKLCGMTDSDEIDRRVTAALANVGMEKYKKRTPDTLSGGQQQRIAIARAIVKNPKIILADEPTGNLDEINTVMIMDLLRAISRDHLVLLVTHEANLVDHYCDTVIELADGKVVNIKNNKDANGFAARDKNDIYLGELEKSDMADSKVDVEYYGSAPDTPVRLKIVNHGGKLYVSIDSENVQIIDEFSEIKLKEGVYVEKKETEERTKSVDMSELPTFEGTSFGKLFSFGNSIKSGYNANFRNGKKGKKLLRGCMSLFAAVVVFMAAVFGSGFGDIIEAKRSYNHNVFYLYTPNEEVSGKLVDAIGNAETGIDYIRLSGDYLTRDVRVGFMTGNFETFSQMSYESGFETNAVYLDVSLVKGKPIVEGKEDLGENEILISTKVADSLLEKSTLGYIKEYKDLIGLSTSFMVYGGTLRIAGIVESDESAIYMSELGMAKYVRRGMSASATSLASDYSIDVNEGETILAIRNMQEGVKYPKVGETVMIQGRELEVVKIIQAQFDYQSWLDANGIKKMQSHEFFNDLAKELYPDATYDELLKKIRELENKRYFEYYDYFYSEIDDFCKDYMFFEPNNMEVWLYVEKGIDAGKYIFIGDAYYKAVKYKEAYGEYPSLDKLDEIMDSGPYPYEELNEYRGMYEHEFYSGVGSQSSFGSSYYLLSDADYIMTAKQLGETHESAHSGYGGGKDIYYGEGIVVTPMSKVYVDTDISYSGTSFSYYTVIHSNDPEKTAAWLEENFSDLENEDKYFRTLITPDSVFDSLIENTRTEIITSLITMAALLVLMALCMYFIMRSSLMNRIKEVGIYRAIGVSKKNLLFKFFIEAVVLTLLSVFIGYLLTSGFLMLCLGMSSLVESIFYYPLWLALSVLAVITALSLFFGTLPVFTLLKKTPSEILAKYDI